MPAVQYEVGLNHPIYLPMKKALLILAISLSGSVAFAQGTAPKEPEAAKPVEKQEVPAPAKPEVKAVPQTKSTAKPERVVTNKPDAAKPAVNRPGRSPRPMARPVRPGRGR